MRAFYIPAAPLAVAALVSAVNLHQTGNALHALAACLEAGAAACFALVARLGGDT